MRTAEEWLKQHCPEGAGDPELLAGIREIQGDARASALLDVAEHLYNLGEQDEDYTYAGDEVMRFLNKVP